MNVFEITTTEGWTDSTGGSGYIVVRIRTERTLRELYNDAYAFGNPERTLFVEMCEIKSGTKGKKWTPWVEAAIPLSNIQRVMKVADDE